MQILVCYSSQTGNGRRLAEDFSREINEGLESDGSEKLAKCNNVRDLEGLESLQKVDLICMFVSSYGDGEQSDDGSSFYEMLRSSNSDPPTKTSFTIFGLGSSLYDRYQGAAIDIKKELVRLGFQGIGMFGKGDDGKGTLEDDYREWKFDIMPDLAKHFKLQYKQGQYHPAYEIQEAGSRPSSSEIYKQVKSGPYHEDNPYGGKVTNITRLTKGEKPVIGITIQLCSDLQYETGDHVGIYPYNSDEDVEEFLRTLGLWDKRDTEVTGVPTDRISGREPFPTRTTYWEVCKYFLEMNGRVSRYMLRDIAKYFVCEETIKSRIIQLTTNGDRFMTEVVDRKQTIGQILGHIKSSWQEIPFTFLLDRLGKLKPRYYSISSSSIEQPGSIDIGIGIIKEERGGFEGVFSKNIEELKIGATLRIFMEKTKFHLPRELSSPIMMICAGTGFCGIRGFLREIAVKGTNRSLVRLYYGVRRKDRDILYENEWDYYKTKLGKSFEVEIAESRGSGKKTYVEDSIKRDSDKITQIIKGGGRVYVCGSVSMGRGVNKEIIEAVAKKVGGIKAADKFIKLRKILGRYKEDVW